MKKHMPLLFFGLISIIAMVTMLSLVDFSEMFGPMIIQPPTQTGAPKTILISLPFGGRLGQFVAGIGESTVSGLARGYVQTGEGRTAYTQSMQFNVPGFNGFSSDFRSDPDQYERELDAFLREVKKRRPRENEIRLGYLGVPPIFGNFYESVESLGARVVFNEIQRQFSMPHEEEDMIELYLRYTYPYEIKGRIEDIKRAIKDRELDGLIHYTQTFCYRQIYDIILRESLSIPMLTLEADRPGKIDGRTALRLETFVEMLRDKK